MSIKRILLLLVVSAVLALATSCGDSSDGNTSGSAESNGMISDQTDDRTTGETGSANVDSASGGIGDDLSDLISDAGDVVSDIASDVEEGVSDLFGDDGSDTQG